MVDILNLYGIEAFECSQENNAYHIKATISQDVTICDHCGQTELVKNGHTTSMYKDTPIHNHQVGIYLKRRRYKCKNCKSTIYQPCSHIHEHYNMTKRLVDYIFEQSMNVTFQQVADQVGCDEKTIRRIFEYHSQLKLSDYRPITPIIMGIDEVHLINHPRLVITNIREKTVIEMFSNRNKATLESYLRSINDRHKITAVTIDMWRPYRDAVTNVLPHAVIIIDKFHVLQIVQEGLETARKSLRGQLTISQRKKLKNDRFILLKRYKDLSGNEIKIMEDWFESYPALEKAYVLKEAFFNVYTISDCSKAIEAYEAIKRLIDASMIPYYGNVIKTIENWKTEIFNYFSYSYTNATTEALNGLIKLMSKNGRGYSFDVLRAKTLLSKRKVKGPKKFVRKAEFYSMDMLENLPYFGVDLSTLKAEWD